MDVSITHPCCESVLSSASVPGGAARVRETTKLRKPGYAERAAKEKNATLVPFVMESYGRFGNMASQLLQFVADRLHHRDTLYECDNTIPAILFEMRRNLTMP